MLAIFFFILGIIGILIPVMPQVIFFVMGLVFLSLVSPTVRRAVRTTTFAGSGRRIGCPGRTTNLVRAIGCAAG